MATKADQPGVMIEVGSAAFNEAVAAAVRTALAVQPPAPPAQVSIQTPAVIPVTSIDTTKPNLDDVTVRFNRFCTFQNCAYQRGQEAGFPRAAAEALVESRAAVITHDPRRAARAA